MADQKTPPPSQGLAQGRPGTLAESMINLTLLDPARWGWTAAGGVADLLSPHEVRTCLRRCTLAGVSCDSEFSNVLNCRRSLFFFFSSLSERDGNQANEPIYGPDEREIE
jgi:hypothetical protein